MSSDSLVDRIADPIDAAVKLGQAIGQSGKMFGCQNVAQGIVIAFHCIQTNLPLLDFQARFHLVEGKPAKKAEAMLASFLEDGGKYYWIEDGSNGTATIDLLLPGEDQRIRFSYSMDEAKQAGLIKPASGWMKNPKPMLRARCASGALRMHAPHLVVGVYTPEELEDIQDDDGPAHAPQLTDGTNFSQSTERPRRSRQPKQTVDSTATPATETAATETPVTDATATATTTEAVPTKGEPTPAAPAAPTSPAVAAERQTEATTQPASQPVNDNLTTDEQITTIATLKQQLNLPAETWEAVLAKLNCPVDSDGKRKIKLATKTQAEHLCVWLQQQAAKAKTAANVKTAEAWLDQGMPVNQVTTPA